MRSGVISILFAACLTLNSSSVVRAGKCEGAKRSGVIIAALMISVGHRTKLFDVMAKIDSATSEQIARAARLDERYVREWLSAMAAAGIVEYYQAYEIYYLPSEHGASLQWH